VSWCCGRCDEVLKRPQFDPDRLGIWGYSYGGYMTAWTIARNHRFKAAVCGAPCFDLESMFGTSDISHFFGVTQWTDTPWNARLRGATDRLLHHRQPYTDSSRTHLVGQNDVSGCW
jgi:dipeptidyl aminopeptidase/acylaminoacyl peptidase